MAKTVKMGLFGRPGTGKSTFASKTPNPLFICTDGNFDWLDLPEKNHIQVSTWKEAKQIINDIVLKKPQYEEYETIVIDLLEDLYVWAEDEFCKKEGIIHIGDYKSMGAGYSVVRKEFFAQISKLLSIDKHVILLSHEADKIGKTKAGADEYTYIPSDKMSLTKLWNDIEGQVRYFLRCYTDEEEVNGRIRTKRYLSLIPGKGEYGICRGADEENWPREIELDWDIFTDIIGLKKESKPKSQKKETSSEVKVEKSQPVKTEVKKPIENVKPEESVKEGPVVTPVPEQTVELESSSEPSDREENLEEVKTETVNEVEQPVDTAQMTPAERAKIIRAKIEAMKQANK